MKYKLFINQYNITKNDYKVREEIVETNDIYHEIGKIYCTSLCDIKRIDYMKIDEKKELQDRIDKAIEYIEQEDWNTEYDKKLLDILKGSDKE